MSFIEQCAEALAEHAHDDGTRRGAEALRSALAGASHTPDRYQPGWLAALDTIDQVVGRDVIGDEVVGSEVVGSEIVGGEVGGSDLAAAFVAAAPMLPWRQASQAGADTSQVAISPLDLVVDVSPVRLGLMYLAPGARTTLHHHPPQEAYLLISGRSSWRYGGSDDFASLASPSTIYNHPNDLHAAVADCDEPLVSMFVLWD